MSASLTQSMAATALGVGRSTVAMWEAGRAVPRTDKLQAMARLYRCTVDDLLQDLRDRGAAAAIRAGMLGRAAHQVCDQANPVVFEGNEPGCRAEQGSKTPARHRCSAAIDVTQESAATQAGERP